MRVQLDVGLSHKLLGAATRAYLSDEPSMDWPALAESAAVTASPDAINRALTRLANEGLIDGLCTPSGWYQVRPSARGLSRAGRAAYRPAIAATLTEDAVQPSRASLPLTQRVSISWDELQSEVQIVRTAGAGAWQRSARTLSPRISAVRTTMAETWRMFTSFP